MKEEMILTAYAISEVAARSGFTAPTLRYYEQIALIPPPQRTQAGYRMYTEDHVRMLDFIGRAKRLGLPLEEIKILVEAWTREDCRATREQLEALVGAKLSEVRHLIGDLILFQNQLEEVYATLSDQPAPRRCGPECGCQIRVDTIDRDRTRELALVSVRPLKTPPHSK